MTVRFKGTSGVDPCRLDTEGTRRPINLISELEPFHNYFYSVRDFSFVYTSVDVPVCIDYSLSGPLLFWRTLIQFPSVFFFF